MVEHICDPWMQRGRKLLTRGDPGPLVGYRGVQHERIVNTPREMSCCDLQIAQLPASDNGCRPLHRKFPVKND